MSQPQEYSEGLPAYSRQCYHMDTTLSHCVYTHSYQGRVFYVGQGRLGRPFEGISRNSRWRAYVREIKAYTINILAYFPDARASRMAETQLLATYEPFCNLDYRGVKFQHDDVPIREDTLTRFPTAKDTQMIRLVQRVTFLEQHCQHLEEQLHSLQRPLCPCQTRLTLWQKFRKAISRIF